MTVIFYIVESFRFEMTLDVNLQQDISNPESDEYKSVVNSATEAVTICPSLISVKNANYFLIL